MLRDNAEEPSRSDIDEVDFEGSDFEGSVGIPSFLYRRSQGGTHAVMLTFPLVKRELGEGVISDTPSKQSDG